MSTAIENIATNRRVNASYALSGEDKFSESFGQAAPGKDFTMYSKTLFRRRTRSGWLPACLILLISLLPALADGPPKSHLKLVKDIQTADYKGDLKALDKLYRKSGSYLEGHGDRSRIHYWRGFAKWRWAINAFNEKQLPRQTGTNLLLAIAEFRTAADLDPAFTEAKIGEASSISWLFYLRRVHPEQVDASDEKMKELADRMRSLIGDCTRAEPDNPRLAWILGPMNWLRPPEQGGGPDVAIVKQQKALDYIRSHPARTTNPLDPTWGEPELLMNLAYYYLNHPKPDLVAAEACAKDALQLVPHWHYVKDILMGQIRDAAKRKG